MEGWMDKEDVVHIYNGILLSHKKEWNNAICSDMDEPRDYHTEWSQTEKDNYHVISYMWNLKKWYEWTYLQNRNSHRRRKQTYGYQGGRDKLGDWDWPIHTIIYKIDN